MQKPTVLSFSIAGVVLVAATGWILSGTAAWVDRPFSGFLLLENGVVASAGLTSWPASSDGEIFQHRLVSYDGNSFQGPTAFASYVESKPIGSEIAYVFEIGNSRIETTIETRMFTKSDAFMLFGASFICAIAFLSVAVALIYIAPTDPASLGTAISFSITGLFALTALDLYGPYRFFRIHAVAECFLGAGMIHMALAFPYRRQILVKLPWLLPSLYAGASMLGAITALFLESPTVYVETHRIAILVAGFSFLTMVISQIDAFVRPISHSTRKRVQILALGTAASITPAFAVLLSSAYSGGGTAENFISWAGAFFPISVAYAVLRADALHIDAIVRRTVSYVTLSVIVGASYAVLIGILEWLIRDHGESLNWISILAFSGFCTFGVLPLRDSIQSWVDRLFFRSAYDFRLTIELTSAVLARLTDLDVIRERIMDTVTTALQPEGIDLTIYPNESKSSEIDLISNPPDATIENLDSGGISIPFQSSNRVVARLFLGKRLSGRYYSGEDRALLQVLANQGAISIENALAIQRLHNLNTTLEHRVEERTAQLGQTIDELKDTQVQLVQAERLAAVGELAAGVAHEVNNPLNFAKNSLRALSVLVDDLAKHAEEIEELDLSNKEVFTEQVTLLAEKFRGADTIDLADDAKELVSILGAGLDRTARLVSDLRDFASPRAHDNRPFDLSASVRSTLQMTRSALRASGIRVIFQVDDDLPQASGDASSMNQVILNLIKNSMDALGTREGGEIRISIVRGHTQKQLVLCLEDNGPGIPCDILSRVFEPFFTTKEAGKGTGLGLAMCRRTMQDYGGNIEILSEPGSGTRSILRIPAFQD